MYAMLCDIFIIVAPPPIDDASEARISTHFRGGSCVRHLGVFRYVPCAPLGWLNSVGSAVRLLPVAIDIMRLVQSRVPGKAHWLGCAQPLLRRVSRRLSEAGHAGDVAEHRPQRFLGRIPVLFIASRRVRAVRPREAPHSDPRRVCPVPEDVDVWSGIQISEP